MALTHKLGKLVPSTSCLFVCDVQVRVPIYLSESGCLADGIFVRVQERFRPIISHFPSVIDTAKRMVGHAAMGSMC